MTIDLRTTRADMHPGRLLPASGADTERNALKAAKRMASVAASAAEDAARLAGFEARGARDYAAFVWLHPLEYSEEERSAWWRGQERARHEWRRQCGRSPK